jgi:hypothetical protein
MIGIDGALSLLSVKSPTCPDLLFSILTCMKPSCGCRVEHYQKTEVNTTRQQSLCHQNRSELCHSAVFLLSLNPLPSSVAAQASHSQRPQADGHPVPPAPRYSSFAGDLSYAKSEAPFPAPSSVLPPLVSLAKHHTPRYYASPLAVFGIKHGEEGQLDPPIEVRLSHIHSILKKVSGKSV